MPRAPLDHDAINEHAPIRLSDAARIAFPGGTMSEKGLRKEVARGNLSIFRVAGKDFTTLADVKRMIERCRAPQKESASNSGEKAKARSGSSAKEIGANPQDAALAIAKALKSGSRPTSPLDTSRPGHGAQLMKFPSQT